MSKTFILTGATGFLGSQLSKKILSDGHQIIFIGKSKKDVSFQDRITELFSEYDKNQIHCIEADLELVTVEDLEHSITAFEKQIHGIWHLAANLSFKEEDRDRVFKANKEGLSKIIALAKSLDAILFHTSTAYIHGTDHGVVKEIFGPKPLQFNNPYEESKYEAEQLIKNSKDLKFMVFRPSIMYDAQAEYVTNFGYYSFLIALHKLRRSLPISKERKLLIPIPFFYYQKSFLNLMPTDLALDWMYSISNNTEAQGLIFHISNPKPFFVGSVFEQTFDAFKLKIPLLGVPLFMAKMYFKVFALLGYIIKPLKPVAQRIYYFKGYLLNHMYYDMTNTRKYLGYNIDDSFNFSKDYIYKLAKAVIIKLEAYKKK